ncbi:MAG: lysostaphin resistance A-like protein [Lachnospiraceae bacterium]
MEKKAYSKVGLGMLAFVVIINVLVLGGQLALMGIKGDESITVAEVLALNFVAEVLIALPVYYFIIRKVPAETPEKHKMGIGNMFSAVCIMYAISVFGAYISTFVNGILFDSLGKTSSSDLEILFETNFALTTLYCVLAAPIVEELVFRKLLIDRLQKYSRKYAIIFSGLLFGLMHGNLEQFFYTFFLGLFFAFIYLRTGKIRYSIILHFIMNGVSTLLQYVMSKIIFINDLDTLTADQMMDILLKNEDQLILFMLMGIIAIAEYVLAFVGLIILIVKRKSFTLGNYEKTISLKNAFINPGMILSIIAMLALMIMGFVL